MLSGHIARSLRGEIEDGTVQLPFRTGSRCGRQRIVHLHERFMPEERILRHFALEQSRSDGIHRDVVRRIGGRHPDGQSLHSGLRGVVGVPPQLRYLIGQGGIHGGYIHYLAVSPFPHMRNDILAHQEHPPDVCIHRPVPLLGGPPPPPQPLPHR